MRESPGLPGIQSFMGPVPTGTGAHQPSSRARPAVSERCVSKDYVGPSSTVQDDDVPLMNRDPQEEGGQLGEFIATPGDDGEEERANYWSLAAWSPASAYRLDPSLSYAPPVPDRPPSPNPTDHSRSSDDRRWSVPGPPWADPLARGPAQRHSQPSPIPAGIGGVHPGWKRELYPLPCGPPVGHPRASKAASVVRCARRWYTATPLPRARPSWYPPAPGTPGSDPGGRGSMYGSRQPLCPPAQSACTCPTHSASAPTPVQRA
eukprot:2419201-Rhodomonas_salina.2